MLQLSRSTLRAGAAFVAALALTLIGAGSANAVNTRGSDTDLFASVNQTATGEANILFILDNGAAASKSAPETCNIDSSGNVVTTAGVTTNATALSGSSFGVIQCGLYAAISSITATSTTSFNISIMMFNSNGIKSYNPSTNAFSSDCSGSDGGCVVLRGTSDLLVPFNSTTKPRILAWIKAWESGGNSNWDIKGPASLASGAIMQESWAFFKGKTGVSGRSYTAPTIGCGKNFVVFVGNAYANNVEPKDSTGTHGPMDPLLGNGASNMNASPAATTAERTPISGTFPAKYNIGSDQLICTKGGSTTSNTYTTSDSETTGTYGLNWAKYMANEHSYRTYSIGLLGAECLPSYSTWLSILASNGGGDFFPTNNYATLKAAFQVVLSQIISVNTVFASVSLPVSVNTQGSFLNQVYIGMFRPDNSFLSRWEGNLKQYKLSFINQVLKLVDADGTAAINPSTGFVTECARSYWTPTAVDTYWANGSSGNCTTISGAASSNYPDGNIVEKGGHAYLLRQQTPSSRVVKTCATTIAGCTSLSNFTTTTTSGSGMSGSMATAFNLSTTADMNTLIDWTRGLNSAAPAQQGAVDIAMANTVMRSTVHGDVMHSRPVAINYGTDAAPKVAVYYGANDGMLHAINGTQSGNTQFTSGGATYSAGAELWSFVPPQFYFTTQRNYENNASGAIYYTGGANTVDKGYGMDGPFTAFKGTLSGSTKYYLYSTMRRGGRMVYAFDITTPDTPSLLWRVGCMNTGDPGSAASSNMMASTDCSSSDFTNIGQTWGSAKIFYSNSVGSGATPLLLMAGGYDPCEDTDTGSANHLCNGAATKGSKVYILNGTDGSVIKAFDTVVPYTGGTKRGVIGDATIVNDSSGKAKYAYIADMGGVVYRMDMTPTNSNSWSMDAIAKLGCSSPASACPANRKFMFQPSVVSTDGSTFWILLGSGDREKPVYGHVASRGVANYFFAIKDQPATGVNSYLAGEQSTCGEKVICPGSLQLLDGSTGTASDSDISAISSKKGWYLSMTSTEQIVTSAITQFGNTTFSTHMPAQSQNSCSNNLGTTRVYNINYSTAASNNGTSNRYEHVSGDGLPPSPVAGKVIIDGATVPFCIGCSKDSPLEGKKATSTASVSRARTRLFWFLEKN